MTGATATATPAAPAAGNATLLSAGGDTPDSTPVTPDVQPPVDPQKDKPDQPLPEGDTPDTPPKEGEEAQEDEGAPEQYTFAAPEGVELDPVAVDVFTPVAKEMRLSQSQAQRLVEVYADVQAQRAQQHAAMVQQWADQVANDPDIGGHRMIANVEAANAVLKRFGTPALNEVLKTSGLCNHPEVVRVLARVGQAMADDTHTIGGNPGQPVDFATGFYGKMPKLEGAR